MIRLFAIYTIMLISASAWSQDRFSLTDQGLNPVKIAVSIKGLDEVKLSYKVMEWMQQNNFAIESNINSEEQDKWIQFVSSKENAIQLGKQQHHILLTIKIRFFSEYYVFEPLEIATKLNSKYDMGWKDFDLKNTSNYFKNKKPIKKTKAFVREIPAFLNELYSSLVRHMNSQ